MQLAGLISKNDDKKISIMPGSAVAVTNMVLLIPECDISVCEETTDCSAQGKERNMSRFDGTETPAGSRSVPEAAHLAL
jgi:hypothetical protein